MSLGGQSGKSTHTQTVETKSAPPQWVQEWGSRFGSEANRLHYLPFSPYPWVPQYNADEGWTGDYRNFITGELRDKYHAPDFTSMLPEIPPATTTALELLKGRALAGSPLLNAAQNTLGETMAGTYLYPGSNPFLRGSYDAASRAMLENYLNATVPQTDAMFSRAGAFGGSAHRLFQAQQANDLQRGLGDLAAQMYGDQYKQERLNQMRGMFFAPEMAQADYRDIQALMSAGDIEREFEMEKAREKYDYWNQAREWPFKMTQIYGSLLPIAFGTGGTQGYQTSTGPNPYYVNPASRIMGGLASGAGLGISAGLATANPLLGAAMGGLGLLAGLFS